MERIVERVIFPVSIQIKLKRVAAYVRVSSGKDAMLHSLSAQISYYSAYIQKNPEWVYCGVYSDEACTGTKEERDGFQKLYADCIAGKIDIIITKSISRFARNTITFLRTIRELKLLGIDVYFEEQNIHTMSADGEFLLTLIASYAQEESRSTSENQKWRVKKNFSEGKPWNVVIFGYRYKNGNFVINPNEAKIVKRIYNLFLNGYGLESICQILNSEKIPTRFNEEWYPRVIAHILKNYTYTGNLLLQKTYNENYITKAKKYNKGELPMYHATETHEPIIPIDTFQAVQEEFKRRGEKYKVHKNEPKPIYPFTSKLKCANCGKNYRRKTTATGIVWICSTFNTKGKSACASKQIPETTLIECACILLNMSDFSADVFKSEVDCIEVQNGNKLVFYLKSGEHKTIEWVNRSRSESWTMEMRQAAKEKALQTRR